MLVSWPTHAFDRIRTEPFTEAMDSDSLWAHETKRRRSALACNTCRGRRTKCDGRRPKCSFCVERGKECVYQEAQDLTPSPLKAELSRLWEQLDHITAVLQGQPSLNSPSESAGHEPGPSDPSVASSGFPFMILRSEAFMNMTGLEQSLSVMFEHVERGREAIPAHSSGANIVVVNLEDAGILLNAYMDHIHIWYPILPTDYTDEFIQATSACFPTSVSSCLALLVLAIGCVVGCESIADARHRGPESVYIDAAMGMLPCVLADSSPSSAQCLLLIALYHLCYARPWQAHDFVAMASYKVQNYLANELDVESDPVQRSIVANCFWSALLMESEITVQLDLLDSGIWSMTSVAPAPTSSPIWSRNSSPPPEPRIPTRDFSYFVAEIAMRKMLQRCTWSTSTLAHGSHVYAPIVAAELERQLDEWVQFLPEHLLFSAPPVPGIIGSSPRWNSNSAQADFLGAQYYAFKASIYWPAVYEAINAGHANMELRRHCSNFFTSYAAFIPSASAAVAVCKPNLWTLCTSVFTISMAALAGMMEPCLFGIIPPEAVTGLDLAIRVFDGVAEVSPSLDEMGAILRERIHLYRCN
ncbi:hypothetical protein BJX68DRAFT_264480 [Aspergillus pseudodeflectus]|uniref:Zn(2)-C6 fungal-type domain-containing protein n=1 Tax=Aspergillus pseudodeflectus TaxID=176178 RepID=A0ABR4KQM6_9EURO